MAIHRASFVRLERSDWVRAGTEILAAQGLEAVRVEELARKLHISKGSFYWHFRDRDDLLQAILETWEADQADWNIDHSERDRSPAERWAKLVELLSRSGYGRLDVAMFSWAHEDQRVARRVKEVEKKRIAYLARVFREIGFNTSQAREWSHAAMLLYVGWVDCATRDAFFGESGIPLAETLSRLVLAASALASQETLRQ